MIIVAAILRGQAHDARAWYQSVFTESWSQSVLGSQFCQQQKEALVSVLQRKQIINADSLASDTFTTFSWRSQPGRHMHTQDPADCSRSLGWGESPNVVATAPHTHPHVLQKRAIYPVFSHIQVNPRKNTLYRSLPTEIIL